MPLNKYQIPCQTTGCQSAASSILEKLDRSFEPCHDFYKFACGNRSNSTVANNLVEFIKNIVTVNQRLQELILETSTTDESRPITIAKKYYAECMNTDLVEKRGLDPLKQLIANFGGWPVVEGTKWKSTLNWTDLTHEFIKSGVRSGFLVEIDVSENILNPAKHNRIIQVIDLESNYYLVDFFLLFFFRSNRQAWAKT